MASGLVALDNGLVTELETGMEEHLGSHLRGEEETEKGKEEKNLGGNHGVLEDEVEVLAHLEGVDDVVVAAGLGRNASNLLEVGGGALDGENVDANTLWGVRRR